MAQQNKLAIGPVEQISVKPGGSVRQELKVTVLPGLHVNNDKPKDDFIIPLKLTWNSGPLEVKSISYPKPEEIQVGGHTLTVFTGTFKIQTDFEAPQHAQVGMTTLIGKLHYQACNNQMCFRPGTIDVRLPVVIE